MKRHLKRIVLILLFNPFTKTSKRYYYNTISSISSSQPASIHGFQNIFRLFVLYLFRVRAIMNEVEKVLQTTDTRNLDIFLFSNNTMPVVDGDRYASTLGDNENQNTYQWKVLPTSLSAVDFLFAVKSATSSSPIARKTVHRVHSSRKQPESLLSIRQLLDFLHLILFSHCLHRKLNVLPSLSL